MSTPALAVPDRVHGRIGQRLYRVTGAPAPVDADDATRMLARGQLVPSVTTVIGALPRPAIDAWHAGVSLTHYADVFDTVARTRTGHAAAMLDAGVDTATVVACLDPAVPVTLLPSIRTRADAAAAARTGRRWVRVTTETLAGKHSPTHLLRVLAGGRVGDPDAVHTLRYRFDRGDITAAAYYAALAHNTDRVLAVLRPLAVWPWLMTRLPAGGGVGLALAVGEHAALTAARSGTRLHAVLEQLVSGGGVGSAATDADDAEAAKITAARAWLAERELVDAHIEHTVFGVTGGGWAGTADVFGVLDGAPVVIDWKTGRRLHRGSVALQLAALAHADTAPITVRRGIGVHVQPAGCRAHVVDGSALAAAYDRFVDLAEAWWATWGRGVA